jgi:hypothetical protein
LSLVRGGLRSAIICDNSRFSADPTEVLRQEATTARSAVATAIERAVEKQPSPARNRREEAGRMKRKE